MRESARLNNLQEAHLIDRSAIGLDNDPVVVEEASNLVGFVSYYRLFQCLGCFELSASDSVLSRSASALTVR